MAEPGKHVGGRAQRWVARLTPEGGSGIDDLLRLPLGLDVWERHDDALVVAASEAQLSVIEQRRLARVERISTTGVYLRARSEALHDSEESGGAP